MSYRLRMLFFLVTLTILFTNSRAKGNLDTLSYSRQEVMIPMRDSSRLNTVIYSTLGMKEPAPFLILRTPYGVSGRA
ncbi:MAG: hypothetical protein M1469_03515 [Bacteroidetes bacterium]|nr:hypothetical protein [Bacteroidota bacterium]